MHAYPRRFVARDLDPADLRTVGSGYRVLHVLPHCADARPAGFRAREILLGRRVERRGYPPEFRRNVLDLLEAGREATDPAHALEISTQTIYTWRRQDRIDRGLEPGLTTASRSS
ncbi:transposase [Nonomuraea sp. NPDC004354]